MRILTLFVALIALYSCKKSGNASGSSANVDSVRAAFFIKENNPYATGSEFLATSAFWYSGSQPIRRSGSYQPAPMGSYSNEYTDKVYDNVTYQDASTILMESRNDLAAQPQRGRWRITLSNGLPVQRVGYKYFSSVFVAVDTAYYYYDGSGRIQKIENIHTVQQISYRHTKTFHFDDKDNLARVFGVYQQMPDKVWYTTEEAFELYDDKPNPLKALWLWDDLYYRTLSRNNFSKYIFKKRDDQNRLTDSLVRIVPLRYDADGKVRY